MKNKLNILYTCDNNYLPLTSISIASVIKNNPDALITFYIATDSLIDDYFLHLTDFYRNNKNVEIVYLNCSDYDPLLESKHLDKWGSNSFYVYWKLFAYDFIDEDYIWYLDSDVICMNKIDIPDISKPIGACLDSAHACFNKTAHIDENYYLFNTGTLFVNIRKWKENECVDKVVDYIQNMKYKPLMCDQDILAVSLQDEIEVLDPKYNFLTGFDYYGVHNSFKMYSLDKKPFYMETEVSEARKNVIFYHCLGGVFGRPWEEGNESPVKNDFAEYRKESAWPDYQKKRNISLLFRIEKAMEILPDFIYNRIHNLAMRRYVKGLVEK